MADNKEKGTGDFKKDGRCKLCQGQRLEECGCVHDPIDCGYEFTPISCQTCKHGNGEDASAVEVVAECLLKFKDEEDKFTHKDFFCGHGEADDEDDFMLPPHIMDRTIFGVDYKEACSVLMHYKQFIKEQITCNIERPKITKEDAEKICEQYQEQTKRYKNAREKFKLKGEE